MDGSEREDGESLHIHIYYIAKQAGWAGASGRSGPDRGRWGQIAGFGQWAR